MAGKDDKDKKGFSGLSDLVSDISGANLVPSAKPEKTVNSPPVSKSTPTTPKLAVPLGTQSSPKTSPMSGKPSPNGWGGGSLGKGFFLAALVGFALYLAWLFSISNEDAKNSADNSQAASRNYTLGQSGAETPAPSANRAPQTPATQYEKPSVGRDNVLSIPQICWCLREDIRIEAMRDVADTEVGITKLNNLVEDYNSRCGSFRYREGALEQAKRTVEAHRSEIVATAVQEARQYVIPLQGKIASRIEHLKHDIAAATSTAHSRKLQKEHDTLRKHLEELRTFDEKLNHHAAQRIPLDLDDGVKVNYAKFGDLLAEVKAVTGGKAEEE